jgi:hypothetical protein
MIDTSASIFVAFTVFLGLAMQITAQSQPPQILQIHRECLKPRMATAYQEIEEDTARICAKLRCPHPYLGIASLTGPKEVWFFNGYNSSAEQKQVVDDYARNAPLLAALRKNSLRKARLTTKPINVFAHYRQELSAGLSWILGHDRFLVITVTKTKSRMSGTVFESADGTRFVVVPAQNRQQSDALAAAARLESQVFAVRPSWSFPAKEWIAADSAFWRPRVSER